MRCAISIHLMLMLICLRQQRASRVHSNFNTSHVNVNRRKINGKSAGKLYFNTSHVNVNRQRLNRIPSPQGHFNTSHVNVNLIVFVHLCDIHKYFNTSHVNVNHAIDRETKKKLRFQYISC